MRVAASSSRGYGAATVQSPIWSFATFAALFAAVPSCASGEPASGERFDAVGAGRDWIGLWPELIDPTAGGSPLPDGAFPATPPSRAQLDTLREAERAWRARDDERFATVRARAITDPVTSFWLARLLVRDLLIATDTAPASTAALVTEVPWRRPFDGLVGIGSAAAPCVVLDLLRAAQADRRDIGARVLAAMGPAALEVWRRVLAVGEARGRRAGVRALALMAADDGVRAALMSSLADPDPGVRAEALRGLGRQGEAGGACLRDRLAVETDPFLRVAIVEGLGDQRDRASAEALVSALAAAFEARDNGVIGAARASLMRMSGRREPGSLVSWQQWVAGLPVR